MARELRWLPTLRFTGAQLNTMLTARAAQAGSVKCGLERPKKDDSVLALLSDYIKP